MKYKFVGFDYNYNTEEPIPAKVEKWYFRQQRSWVVQLKDNEGNQIGDATYVYTKKEADEEINRLKKEYNL